MPGAYAIDNNGEPFRLPDLKDPGGVEALVGAFSEGSIRVAWTQLTVSDDEKHVVSTVFLVIDHSPWADSPTLWETMILGGPHDGYQERYKTLKEAAAGHRKAVRVAFGENAPETEWGTLPTLSSTGKVERVHIPSRWERLLGEDLV